MYFPLSRAFLFRTVVLGILLFCAVGEGYGQRVYANTEQHSAKQTTGLPPLVVLTLSEVKNWGDALTANETTYSTLSVALGALNLYSATQNLQFTGANATKLKPTSPIMVKAMVNGSVLGLLDAVSLQRTNGGMNNTVSTPYTVNQLLDLLGLIGRTDEELLVVLPVPGATQTNDGVQLKVSSVLSLGFSARLYYAFYITPPEIQATITACIGETGTATITNFQTGYTYRLYNTLVNGSEITGTATTTATLGIPADLPAGDYYLEAREVSTLYPSARTKITVIRNAVKGGTIKDNQTLCANTKPAELTQNTVSTGSGVLTYQWQSKTSGAYTDILGATASAYSPPILLETTMYRRKSTSILNGVSCEAFSNEITITVNPLPTIVINSTTTSACQETTFFNLVYTATTNNPISYTVDWNSTAETAGFVDIYSKIHSFSPGGGEIPIPLPANVAAGSYQGVLTIKNSNDCTSNGQNIMVNIRPKPPAPSLNINPNSQY